jgi:hypothetical protein
MPTWKKDAKEFTVSVNYSDGRGYQSSIPIPVINKLGKPNKIKFIINDGDSVQLKSVKTHVPRKPTKMN